MRGKTGRGFGHPRRGPHCFNEAPAECGGKQVDVRRQPAQRLGFNEAPAECGGKRASSPERSSPASRASMRPPQNAGENTTPTCIRRDRRRGFNEAPAECGGKQPNPDGFTRLSDAASMRPPQNAGENLRSRHHRVDPRRASMRPPQNAGENWVLVLREIFELGLQ